ncbi:MAG TPA: sugar ABC transporter permease [Bacilli bacterium]|jgi:multiple sugar transport system permease protein|nr:MAG: L-arabinose transport system permease protein AraP [Tenericutes bacterium ADurb.Bin140]HOE77648.1 sugar ABC transporter permease [Bacilli bacterium]HON64055.1 sugar ABC transporter permease [Bacilli bacterium]HOR96190.1 sugar ABC transporter permease [Bacilli bacterium]HPD12486.1 sugar ABC transporter permease [Bacilli bacterium]
MEATNQSVNSARKNKRALIWKQVKANRTLYSMMAPYLVIFFVFTVIPVFVSFLLSFTSYDMLQRPRFVGLDNYLTLFLNDEVFITAIRNTFILALFTGPISYLLAFFFAWLINELPRRLRWVMTLIFYAPSISGNAYLLWSLIFSGDMYGYANAILINLGFINEPIIWLQNTKYILPILIIVQLWLSLGVSFLAFIGGLQNTNKELNEAGAIDGIQNRWQELWYITLPQMKPQLLFGAVMQITTSLGIASVSIALAGLPSVEYAGHTIVTHLIDYGSNKMELGYASSIATILFFIMIGANLLVQKILRRVGS